ncbi:unnamed protein product [Penicillium glandicola]
MIGNSQLFLFGLVGTEITLPSSDSLKIRGNTWVIDKKLNEISCNSTREDLDRDGHARTVGAAPESAFMRIYSQVPIGETQFLSPEVRAKQAVPPYQHGEVMALKKFKEGGCTIVPEVLS